MNGIDWIQSTVWIGLVLLLGVVEIFTLDFIFIMLAAGAAGGALTSGRDVNLGRPAWR